MKACFKCGQSKPLTEFYKHKRMADGHLNKCKDCAKNDVHLYRVHHPEIVSATDQRREQNPERRRKKTIYQKARRARSPEKDRARRILNYNVRVGNMTRQPCEVCGESKSQAHHHDYSRPLDVKWLCFKHHREDEHDQVVVQG